MENDIIRPKTLRIRGRNVTFQRTCGQVADCTFAELCDRVSTEVSNEDKLITNKSFM